MAELVLAFIRPHLLMLSRPGTKVCPKHRLFCEDQLVGQLRAKDDEKHGGDLIGDSWQERTIPAAAELLERLVASTIRNPRKPA